MSLAIGVDVGGSGIKVAAVDLETGALASERIRVLTPVPVHARGGDQGHRPPREADQG